MVFDVISSQKGHFEKCTFAYEAWPLRLELITFVIEVGIEDSSDLLTVGLVLALDY